MGGTSPFEPMSVLLIALLNPAVIVVAFLMGRAADQWQKILVAGFAASLAGFVVLWIATYLRIVSAKGFGGEAGIVVLQFVFGMVWAAIGYWVAPKPKKA